MIVHTFETAVQNPFNNDIAWHVNVQTLAQGWHVEDDYGTAVHGVALWDAVRHRCYFGASLRRGIES